MPRFKVYVCSYEKSPYHIEWMRYEPGSPVPDIVKNNVHIAFEVDNLADVIKNKKIIIEPNSPSEGVQVAFIEEDGALVELMQIDNLS